MKSLIRASALAAASLAAFLAYARADAQEPATVKEQFGVLCATCHGENGDGNGPTAKILNIKPRNFTDCAAMAKIPDATLFTAIRDGGAAVGLNSAMPRWRESLDDQQIKALVAYVRSRCKR